MSAFEFVFGFVTIISSLALTHLAASVVGLIRNSHRIRFSIVQAAFMWAAFTTTIVNWAGFWPLQRITAWPSWLVMVIIAVALAQYIFCALVTPERIDAETDLREWDDANRSRYILAALPLAVLAILQNVGVRDYDPTWLISIIGCLAYGGLVLLTCMRNQTIRTAAAVAFAALTSVWMYLSCTFVPIGIDAA